jgi:hypothetical protein
MLGLGWCGAEACFNKNSGWGDTMKMQPKIKEAPMKKQHQRPAIKPLNDPEVLEAYLRKNALSKYDARRIHRQLRKLFFAH